MFSGFKKKIYRKKRRVSCRIVIRLNNIDSLKAATVQLRLEALVRVCLVWLYFMQCSDGVVFVCRFFWKWPVGCCMVVLLCCTVKLGCPTFTWFLLFSTNRQCLYLFINFSLRWCLRFVWHTNMVSLTVCKLSNKNVN